MAASPEWKVYSREGEYLAACKHPEDAAQILDFRGDGTQVRHGHSLIVWIEGQELRYASQSYDLFYQIIDDRRRGLVPPARIVQPY